MKELIANNHPKSSVAESLKTIKTNLRFSSVNKKIKTILITSSIASEGKSFISANLATTFTSETEKVLLIDCDLRKGRQHIIFNIDNNIGLSDLIIDTEWKKKLKKYIKNTEINNLDIITTGTTPPNPSTLLESQKLEQIMEKLKEQYDVIIFDTPPVSGITDTLLLSRLADTVLVVAKSKKTTLELLENTKKALENINANIAGVILNKVNKNNDRYYKNYY